MNAIYAGSFDPLTYGHINIILRAVRMYGKLTVAVANNPEKKYLFSTSERSGFIQSLDIPKVKVVELPEKRLVADFAFENEFNVLVKGVRSLQDYDYEKLLHEVSLTQQLGIDTSILLCDPSLGHVSSSASKELCKLYGDIRDYVPLHVKRAMEIRLVEQNIIGVTGSIAVGKSLFCNNIASHIHHIDLDVLAHDILQKSDLPVHVSLRKIICRDFGLKAMKTVADRKRLGKMVFSDVKSLAHLNRLMREPILTALRQQLVGRRGTVIINGALLAEAGYLDVCNNNVILITATEEEQIERLKKRGLTKQQALDRLAAQFTTQQKATVIENAIASSNYGKLVKVRGDADFFETVRKF